jgi:hypothetical protein
VRISQKARRDTSCGTCVFASSAICGSSHAVCELGARNIDALFLMLGWACCETHKKLIGTRHVELVFCIRVDLRVM